MSMAIPTRILAAAGPDLDAALDGAVEELLETLLSLPAGSGAAEILARLRACQEITQSS